MDSIHVWHSVQYVLAEIGGFRQEVTLVQIANVESTNEETAAKEETVCFYSISLRKPKCYVDSRQQAKQVICFSE